MVLFDVLTVTRTTILVVSEYLSQSILQKAGTFNLFFGMASVIPQLEYFDQLRYKS